MDSKTVIKLNNIPHGFYEDQMRDYFSQFGGVKNVLLIRSKKTHKSRGFGFVEFHLPQVARAAAESMHNYLLFNNVLKCRQMNRNDLPKGFFMQTFKGANSVDKTKKAHNITLRDDKKIYQHYKKILATQEKLKDMGVPFECHIINRPALKSSPKSPEKSPLESPKKTVTKSPTSKNVKTPEKIRTPAKVKTPAKSPQKPTKSPTRKTISPEKPSKSIAKPSKLPVKAQKSPDTSASKIPRRVTRSSTKLSK